MADISPDVAAELNDLENFLDGILNLPYLNNIKPNSDPNSASTAGQQPLSMEEPKAPCVLCKKDFVERTLHELKGRKFCTSTPDPHFSKFISWKMQTLYMIIIFRFIFYNSRIVICL